MCADFNFYLNRQGVRGVQGVKGDDGFSPIITVAQDNAEGYKLHIQTATDDFDTSNLRPPITNAGGKYLLWDNVTGAMTAGFLDYATTEVVGGVNLATAEDMEGGENTQVVPSVRVVADYVESKLGQLTADVTQAGNNTFTGTNTFNNNVTFNNPVEFTNNVDLRGVTVAHEGITAKKIGSADGYMVFNNINDTPTELAFGDTTANTTIRSAGDIKAVINGSTETTITTDADLQVVRDEVNSTTDKVEALDTAVDELKANATTQGNVFNGANQLVQLDSEGKLPAIDGSQLTNLPSGGGGTGDVTAAGDNTFSGSNTFGGNTTFTAPSTFNSTTIFNSTSNFDQRVYVTAPLTIEATTYTSQRIRFYANNLSSSRYVDARTDGTMFKLSTSGNDVGIRLAVDNSSNLTLDSTVSITSGDESVTIANSEGNFLALGEDTLYYHKKDNTNIDLLNPTVDLSEINSQISAMQADITAIEQQIGNIVTRLNEINGENI